MRATNLFYLPNVYSYPDEVLKRITEDCWMSLTLAAVGRPRKENPKSHIVRPPSLSAHRHQKSTAVEDTDKLGGYSIGPAFLPSLPF
jgi:hypothetical protein